MNTVYQELTALKKFWTIWYLLGNQDIKLKYRRSKIGPFWITISMGVTIFCMGFLYSYLFRVDLSSYFPYLTSGIVCWTFISTLIIELSSAFIVSENFIKNQPVFFTIFIMRVVFRNVIIFSHNLLVFVVVFFIYDIKLGWAMLLLVPGIFIICINAITWGSMIAFIGTRYRDFQQIIASLIQVIFFITPVMWLPTAIPGKYHWLFDMNPFYHFLSLIRAPLLNGYYHISTIFCVILVTGLGLVFYYYALKKYKHRVVFWL